jgi:pimeloyl-ACP methyl ester carboxylesterase
MADQRPQPGHHTRVIVQKSKQVVGAGLHEAAAAAADIAGAVKTKVVKSGLACEYAPNHHGYAATLRSSSEVLLIVSRPSFDTEASVTDPGQEDYPATIAALTAFGDNEFRYRHARATDKRKSFRRADDDARDKALFIAALMDDLTDDHTTGWCSACCERAPQRRTRGYRLPKPTYICTGCGTPTTLCAIPGCLNFAVVWPLGATGTIRYCAEHRHDIPSFEKLQERIETIDEYPTWLSFEAKNAAQITKVAMSTIGGAAVLVPGAIVAAPAIGALIGTSAWGGGLAGAAAISHGLAMLGGGSIAAGGLGVAGETMVIAAAGGALGGVLGGRTASAYASDDKSFTIAKVRDGTGPAVLFAAGWFSGGHDTWDDFQTAIDARYPASPVYQIRWGAKELKDLQIFAGRAALIPGAKKVAFEAAKHGLKAAATKLNPLAAVFAAADLAANPWTVAAHRATMTGAVLADAIARTDHESFVLIGHSLGARVMVTAAQALGTRDDTRTNPKPRIGTMHLLGAAVSTGQDWLALSQAVSGTIWNYYSRNDPVLKWAYTVGEHGQTSVGRTGFHAAFANIKDRNVSATVHDHLGYFTEVTLA